MLAELSNVLRIDLILTTNFDDILERAFERVRKPLTVFDVVRTGSLPDQDALRGSRGIVKLHGSRAFIRADYSTDNIPSEEDRERFASYFFEGSGVTRRLNKHLLVMGSSGYDKRIAAMIQETALAANKSSGTLKVFWVAYTESDAKQAVNLSEEYNFECIVTRHTQLGLLLMELYQTVRKTIPSLGSLFPSPSRLTTPPSPRSENARDETDEAAFRLVSEKFSTKDMKPLVFLSDVNHFGLTTAASRLFETLETRGDLRCLWIEMNDITDISNLFEVILEAVHYRLGVEDWIPSAFTVETADASARAKELSRLTKPTGKTWTIFINARERPGANMESDDVDPNTDPNGWLGRVGKWNDFEDLLQAFEAVGIKTVLLATGKEGIAACDDESNPIPDLRSSAVTMTTVAGRDEQIGSRVREVTQWCATDKARLKFVKGLFLMQRPRLLAAIWSDALRSEGSDPVAWLQDLEEKNIIRFKPGGLIWIHASLRNKIRKEPLFGAEAKLHAELARWYEKVAIASDSPSAVLEAIHHHCMAAATYNKEHRVEHCIEQLKNATALLRTSTYLIQTHGFANGSCSMISARAATVCAITSEDPKIVKAKQTFFQQCAATMRAVAREAGADAKAFLRHAMFAELEYPGGTPFELTWEDVAERCASARNVNPRVKQKYKEKFDNDSCARIRWHRWTTMLHVASRTLPTLARIKRVAEKSKKEHIETRLVETLRYLEVCIDATIQSVGVCKRLEAAVPHDYDEPMNDGLLLANDLVAQAKKMARRVQANDSHPLNESTQLANGVLARLHIHQSVLTSLRANTSDGPTAFGLLEDAEGLIKHGPSTKMLAELALVEIHRAEAVLNEVAKVALTQKGPGGAVFRLSAWVRDGGKKAVDRHGLNRANVLAWDAMRHLDRAAPILRERRRNVWWTTFYFERRLRALEYLLWTTDPSTPLPYVGAEYVLYDSDSEVDVLLEDALRMIRVDSYRLATILMSYNGCIGAIRYQNSVRQSEALTKRIADMEIKLRDGAQRLNQVHRNRLDVLDKWHPHDYIKKYVEHVMGTLGPYHHL